MTNAWLGQPILNYGIGIWSEEEKENHLEKNERLFWLECDFNGEKIILEANRDIYDSVKLGDRINVKVKKNKICSYEKIWHLLNWWNILKQKALKRDSKYLRNYREKLDGEKLYG